MHKVISSLVILLAALALILTPASNAQEEFSSLQDAINKMNSHSSQDLKNATIKTIFTSYSGPQLPKEWTLVSVLNDRAVIGFANGSSRNALIEDLNQSDKAVVEKVKNGTLSGPGIRDKLAQWSSTVSTKVTQFGKSIKDQFGSVFGNPVNSTTTTTTTTVNSLPSIN